MLILMIALGTLGAVVRTAQDHSAEPSRPWTISDLHEVVGKCANRHWHSVPSRHWQVRDSHSALQDVAQIEAILQDVDVNTIYRSSPSEYPRAVANGTALMTAAREGCDPKLVTVLLEHGADPNIQSTALEDSPDYVRGNRTALHYVVEGLGEYLSRDAQRDTCTGRADVLKALLGAGARVVPDTEGDTPLHLAAQMVDGLHTSSHTWHQKGRECGQVLLKIFLEYDRTLAWSTQENHEGKSDCPCSVLDYDRPSLNSAYADEWSMGSVHELLVDEMQKADAGGSVMQRPVREQAERYLTRVAEKKASKAHYPDSKSTRTSSPRSGP